MAKRKTSSSGTGTRPSIDLLNTVSRVSNTNRSLKVGTLSDLTRLSIGEQTSAKPMQFGSPSQKGTASTRKGASSWTDLLGSVSTGGISDFLGGGGLVSAGLDYLSNGIESFFGAGTDSSAEALNRFVLPDSQQQSIYVNNLQTNNSSSTSLSGAYNNSQSSKFSQASKAEIVQTVKNALLTSSTLNDVIGEL